ncbi:ROK family protein [Luteolibacter luteus]|uniref:fructokinase n=1 Tax=Luteolibacter luteus TaxID=2728835 RepID=A0A858RKR1_9BACT|nr:ROK family protein [Luteolibacter luteus]QJE97084.1 ROK family protein [Luteolibacter luteus]
MIAGIELGGTKTVVATGTGEGAVTEEWRFPTTTPEETFSRATGWLRERGTPSAIGVAAFGPLGVVPRHGNYGKLLATPKPGWADYSIIGALHEAFPGAQVTIETDVNAAALAEARIGAASGMEDVAYITIGTGIGAGILSGGHLIHGTLHPEFGHLKVPRKPDDHFAGVCPFHADCLEGLASGPSMAARWGKPAHELPPDHPAWNTEAWYLAHGALSLVGIVAPERVIIGGGVSQAEGFHEKVETLLNEIAAGYFAPIQHKPYIVAPHLEQQAGIIGALLLTAR